MARRCAVLFLVLMLLSGVLGHVHTVGRAASQPRLNGPWLPRAFGTPPVTQPLVVLGDRIRSVVPAQPDARAIYVVGGHGLYRSDDSGKTWHQTGPVPPNRHVVAGGDQSQLLLAGDRLPCAGVQEGTALSRSSDGGTTWATVEGTNGVWPLAIWDDPPLTLGADCAGLRRSTDGGRTWKAVPGLDSGYTVTAFASLPADSATERDALVVGTSEGGTSRLWHLDLADPGTPRLGEALTEFWGAGSLAGDERLYVLGTGTGVRVSVDGGVTWREHRTGLEDVTISVDPRRGPIPEDELRRGFGIDAIAIDPEDHHRLYAGTVDGLYASRDAGRTWQRWAGLDGRVAALRFAPGADQLLAQTEMGVVEVPLRP